MNYKNLVVSIIFVIFITLTLQLFDNKSGCDGKYVLPSVVVGLSIYLIGNWDTKKPEWCPIDIITWIVLFILSFGLCCMKFPYQKNLQ